MNNKLPYSEKYNCIHCEYQYSIKIGGHGGTEHFCNNYNGNMKVDYYDGRFTVRKEINDCKNFKFKD